MSGMDLTPYREFAKDVLGLEFENIDTFVTALTHRSYVNEHKKSATEHNERLEFLGDAVLELVVTDYLFANYDEPEGILTSWRASLVRTESIGAAGESVGYAPLVRMSKGEKNGSDRARLQILANAFEAVVGAIYLEFGYDTASDFIHKNIIVKLDDILLVKNNFCVIYAFDQIDIPTNTLRIYIYRQKLAHALQMIDILPKLTFVFHDIAKIYWRNLHKYLLDLVINRKDFIVIGAYP